MKPRRDLWRFYVLGAIFLVAALYGVRWYVRDQASKSATAATKIASAKAETARIAAEHALAKVQHDQVVKDYKSSLVRCGRNNLLRKAIADNTKSVGQLALELASSRRIAATLEVTGPSGPLAIHDRKVADGYVKLAQGLSYPQQIDCKKLYPDPFAGQHHS